MEQAQFSAKSLSAYEFANWDEMDQSIIALKFAQLVAAVEDYDELTVLALS